MHQPTLLVATPAPICICCQRSGQGSTQPRCAFISGLCCWPYSSLGAMPGCCVTPNSPRPRWSSRPTPHPDVPGAAGFQPFPTRAHAAASSRSANAASTATATSANEVCCSKNTRPLSTCIQAGACTAPRKHATGPVAPPSPRVSAGPPTHDPSPPAGPAPVHCPTWRRPRSAAQTCPSRQRLDKPIALSRPPT